MAESELHKSFFIWLIEELAPLTSYHLATYSTKLQGSTSGNYAAPRQEGDIRSCARGCGMGNEEWDTIK